MTLPAPTYDLVLMLDLQAGEPTRAKIVAGARTAIESQGQLLRHDEWGERTLAYPIDHKTSAEYHLLQFHATPELLSTLNRTLRITDELIRFRIIKLAPGTPEAPEMPAQAGAAPRVQAAPAAEAEAAPVPEAEVAPEAEAEVAPATEAESLAAEPTAEAVAAEPTAETLATPAALSEPA
ncbi:MAG TPA: 30S ribosomal protein S6 [Solirubrobacteraceae bacterium]|jgi:small subunit ribosomal protein S6|nr:30S ribosomal protein S6 [Solirubrobacteraceae bacterium]